MPSARVAGFATATKAATLAAGCRAGYPAAGHRCREAVGGETVNSVQGFAGKESWEPGMMISKAVTVIVRRQSPDWSNINDAFWLQLAEFERFMGRPPGGIRDLIELWNRTFSESFFNIRNKMKIMTDANLNWVSKAKIIDLDRYRARHKGRFREPA